MSAKDRRKRPGASGRRLGRPRPIIGRPTNELGSRVGTDGGREETGFSPGGMVREHGRYVFDEFTLDLDRAACCATASGRPASQSLRYAQVPRRAPRSRRDQGRARPRAVAEGHRDRRLARSNAFKRCEPRSTITSSVTSRPSRTRYLFDAAVATASSERPERQRTTRSSRRVEIETRRRSRRPTDRLERVQTTTARA